MAQRTACAPVRITGDDRAARPAHEALDAARTTLAEIDGALTDGSWARVTWLVMTLSADADDLRHAGADLAYSDPRR